MPDLRNTRKRLWWVIAVLLALDVTCAALLLTPIAGRESLRQDEMQQLWLTLKARQTAPWRGLDKKLPEAREEISSFYKERLPSGYSAISTNLDQIASSTGVKVESEKYQEKDPEVGGLEPIEIQAQVSGDYLPLVKFINSLERSKLFFVVDDLRLGGQESGKVQLQIKLETYLRTAQ
jgi:type IV pilus assembly protein PilO